MVKIDSKTRKNIFYIEFFCHLPSYWFCIPLSPPWHLRDAYRNNRWLFSALMFSRNFWFVRSKSCFDVFLWNLPFVGRSIISRWLICDPYRRMTKKIVAGLRTSARIMPKRRKVTRSTEQTLLKNKHEAGVIESAISLTKDGQISVRVLAKPGAKQSNITGKNFYEKPDYRSRAKSASLLPKPNPRGGLGR